MQNAARTTGTIIFRNKFSLLTAIMAGLAIFYLGSNAGKEQEPYPPAVEEEINKRYPDARIKKVEIKTE